MVTDITRVESALSNSIKSDLNLVYTEPPFQVDGGWDFGWFCREHAFHVFLLARLLGFDSSIILGDVVIRFETLLCSTVGQGGHAWCRVGDAKPVDISICLGYLKGFDETGAIFGQDSPGGRPYMIKYRTSVDKDELNRIYMAKTPTVTFIERERVANDPLEVLDDPFRFLIPPASGAASFTDHHGREIFDMITMHCYKLALGRCKPVSAYMDRKAGLEKIKKWNRGAAKEIRRLLRF